MSEQMISAGRWNSLKGELKSRWAALTDSDFQHIGGNVDKLVGTIQQKTGETQQNIEDWLRSQGYGDLLKYSWSDIAQMLEQNIVLTIAGALLLGFGLGRLSKPTYSRRFYAGPRRSAWSGLG